MSNKNYRSSFLEKLAELDKSALTAADRKNMAAQWAKNDEASEEVLKRKPYRRPQTLADYGSRALTHLNSLGRGIGSALWTTGLRAGQGAIDLATWVPLLADKLVMGKLIGIDEGRGIFGRMKGKLDRGIDYLVDKGRTWSSDYDYVNRINGRFNRFLNGRAADAIGSFIGWGGVGNLLHKRMLGTAFGAFGGIGALSNSSREGQLRAREEWIRKMDPRVRRYIDPTSTAENQENAPTAAEYQRYHMPSSGLPASASGRIRIPYYWRHQANGSPVQFRDFGT